MKYQGNWLLAAKKSREDQPTEWMPATVPGCVQTDYARAHGWPDVNYGENARMYDGLEDLYWQYRVCPQLPELKNGERRFFVAKGIDYSFEIYINEKLIYAQEGMFTPVELDITDEMQPGDTLNVLILPAPKRKGARPHDRQEADESVKPAVSYGWDWHPYLVVLGIWEDCYFETRPAKRIVSCEPFYELSEDRSKAFVRFETVLSEPESVIYTLIAPDGQTVYKGTEPGFSIESPLLWWCRGQGVQNLYTWTARSESGYEVSGRLGFRSIELSMNADDWNGVNGTRANPPMTVTLNGRRIFAKGSNWVNPEIFPGAITYDTYLPLLKLCKDANFNLLRVWGGAIVNKESFFELCDEMGIMVWQEFPLACNNYKGGVHYLKILEQEAVSIIKRVRRHPCHVLWCGGNELFCGWSGMTDQSLPLRLLNKLCYEYDINKPFIPTSPIMNVSHGWYRFLYQDKLDVMQVMQTKKHATAYTEFGVPSLADAGYLKKFIPENELFPPEPGAAYEFHHAFNAWGGQENWLPRDILNYYFAPAKNLEELVAQTDWLQSEGYKAIFEEARRQKPYCSMALNWCYNEPWPTAANNSLVSYPAIPKKALKDVGGSCRDLCLSLRIPRFDWKSGDTFRVEPWLLNDSPLAGGEIAYTVTLSLADKSITLGGGCFNGTVPNENSAGAACECVLPGIEGERFTVSVCCKERPELDSSYTLLMRHE